MRNYQQYRLSKSADIYNITRLEILKYVSKKYAKTPRKLLRRIETGYFSISIILPNKNSRNKLISNYVISKKNS